MVKRGGGGLKKFLRRRRGPLSCISPEFIFSSRETQGWSRFILLALDSSRDYSSRRLRQSDQVQHGDIYMFLGVTCDNLLRRSWHLCRVLPNQETTNDPACVSCETGESSKCRLGPPKRFSTTVHFEPHRVFVHLFVVPFPRGRLPEWS